MNDIIQKVLQKTEGDEEDYRPDLQSQIGQPAPHLARRRPLAHRGIIADQKRDILL